MNQVQRGTSGLPAHVTLVEVGPRDGLQNEPQPVATAVKVELIERLVQAGIRRIEAAAFVSPKWVPQMADGAEVLGQVPRRPDLVYAALVPNLKGFEAALAARAGEVVVFSAASETFCRKNINCSIAESISKTIAGHTASASLNVLGIGQASTSFSPSLGLIPLNLTGIEMWNSSATASPAASWVVSYSWADQGFNGTTGFGSGTGSAA